MPFAATQMGPEMIMLSEVHQKEKNEYRRYHLTHEIENMTQMSLSTKETDSQA